MVVPPGAPDSGSVTASAGNNTQDIAVPDSELWFLQAVSVRNTSKAVRCRVYIGDGHHWGCILDGQQGAMTENIFHSWGAEGIPLLPSQQLRFEWLGCDANDVLDYTMVVRKEVMR